VREAIEGDMVARFTGGMAVERAVERAEGGGEEEERVVV